MSAPVWLSPAVTVAEALISLVGLGLDVAERRTALDGHVLVLRARAAAAERIRKAADKLALETYGE